MRSPECPYLEGVCASIQKVLTSSFLMFHFLWSNNFLRCRPSPLFGLLFCSCSDSTPPLIPFLPVFFSIFTIAPSGNACGCISFPFPITPPSRAPASVSLVLKFCCPFSCPQFRHPTGHSRSHEIISTVFGLDTYLFFRTLIRFLVELLQRVSLLHGPFSRCASLAFFFTPESYALPRVGRPSLCPHPTKTLVSHAILQSQFFDPRGFAFYSPLLALGSVQRERPPPITSDVESLFPTPPFSQHRPTAQPSEVFCFHIFSRGLFFHLHSYPSSFSQFIQTRGLNKIK